jgi:hypothetical protein
MTVPIGCINKIDTEIEGPVDDPDAFVVIGVADAAEHHRPQAIGAHFDAGPTKRAILHGCLPGLPIVPA